jgi:hypothetical protein
VSFARPAATRSMSRMRCMRGLPAVAWMSRMRCTRAAGHGVDQSDEAHARASALEWVGRDRRPRGPPPPARTRRPSGLWPPPRARWPSGPPSPPRATRARGPLPPVRTRRPSGPPRRARTGWTPQRRALPRPHRTGWIRLRYGPADPPRTVRTRRRPSPPAKHAKRRSEAYVPRTGPDRISPQRVRSGRRSPPGGRAARSVPAAPQPADPDLATSSGRALEEPLPLVPGRGHGTLGPAFEAFERTRELL